MEDEEGTQVQNPKETRQNPNDRSGATRSTGKSCKGCLFFSSLQKSKSKTPTCIGLSKTLQVPSYIVGSTELEASKQGRSLTDFKYACAGYSVYLDKNNSSSSDPQSKQAELPICVGLEVLLIKKPDRQTARTQVPAHAHKKEENVSSSTIPQPRTYKPPLSAGEEYLNRFTRNAFLIATGVAKDVNKLCNHIKESLDDILYPYRRRPK